MIRDIVFTIMITVLFIAVFLNFPTNGNIEVSAPSIFCSLTFYLDEDNPDYSYTYEYDDGVESLYCVYDGQSLLLETSYYTCTYSSSENDPIFLQITTVYHESGNTMLEDYLFVDLPNAIRIIKLYDEFSFDINYYKEQHSSYNTGILNEIEGLDSSGLLNSEDVYERINEIIHKSTLN